MLMKNKQSKFLFWILVWGLGIIGQLCWNIENQWFNTFVYAKIAKDPTIISWMVAVSAIATTISTFLFGTMSDRLGKRKPFMAIGYILWGIFTILFGTTEFIAKGKGASGIMLAATAVVLADALMSFFGSMGNDASFNAWLNDNMNEENRGGIGAALATQPVIGTIIGTIVGGLLIGSNDNYMRLFTVMGGGAILFGILSLFVVKDVKGLKPYKEGSFFEQLFSAFDLKALLKHKELVWVFLVLTTYFIAFNVYYPHVGNYMIYYLGFSAGDIGIIQGIALILGMFSVIPASSYLNDACTLGTGILSGDNILVNASSGSSHGLLYLDTGVRRTPESLKLIADSSAALSRSSYALVFCNQGIFFSVHAFTMLLTENTLVLVLFVTSHGVSEILSVVP